MAGLPAPLDFNGCDTKSGSNEPAEVHTNPSHCRTFERPSDLLRGAQERFFTTEANSLGGALRGDVEFAVYCRALFHLKAGFRIHPASHLFELERYEPLTRDAIHAGFHRATVYAEVAEAQEQAQ